MPSILDRYIFREITVPFMLGMTAFTGALLMGRFLKIADLIVSKGVPVGKICLLMAYLLPSFALITIPMALLMAILLAFGRLSADSEVIAMKASGVGLRRLMLPVLAFASICGLSTLAIALFAVPAGNMAFKNLLMTAVDNGANIEIRERIFIDTVPGLVIYVENYDKPARSMKGVMIQDNRKPENPLTIFASRGGISIDKPSRQAHLLLEEGSIHNIYKTSYRIVNFREYELNLNLDKAIPSIKRGPGDLTLHELDEEIKKGAKDPRLIKNMELEYHRRFALPFACFIFAVVAVPLGIQNRRSGKGGGFALSIGLLISYYIVLSACETLGEKGAVHAALAMWGPNVVFLILGGWFFIRSAAEKAIVPLHALDAIAAVFSRIIPGRKRNA